MPLGSLLVEVSPAAYVTSGSAWRGSVGEESEQVGPRQHADRLAVLDDEDRVGLLELLARGRDGRAGTDEGQTRLHVLLDGVGEVRLTGEQRCQQGPLADRTGDLARHDGRLGLDDRHLRDAVLAQD